MRPANPFSPSFGISPPVLAGRRDVLNSFDTVFENIRSPSYATLLWGARGVGKTVLLNAVEDRARARGWTAISAVAAKPAGLVGQIASKAARQLRTLHAEHGPAPRRRRAISGVSIMGVGVQTESERPPDGGEEPEPGHDLESTLAELGGLLAERGVGVLVTIDELHVSDLSEIREFGNVFQLVSRRSARPIAFVGAALPELEPRLLSGDASTFLQRCRRHEIGDLRPSEAAAALRRPIETAGGRIGREALAAAVEASRGQPYLVQLIGAYAWDDADDPISGITADDAHRAAADASRQFGQHVYGPVWHTLSDLDKKFLAAMLADDGTSSVADIGRRWGHNPRSLSTYRSRLLAHGLIVSVGRGRVGFTDTAARGYVSGRVRREGFTAIA